MRQLCMKKNDAVYVRLMLDAFRKIGEYSAGISRDEFQADEKTQSAVIMQLQVVGELAKRLSAETTQAIDAPWKDIAGFRDMIAHQYFNLDLGLVWRTIRVSTTPVEESLRVWLAAHTDGQNAL